MTLTNILIILNFSFIIVKLHKNLLFSLCIAEINYFISSKKITEKNLM